MRAKELVAAALHTIFVDGAVHHKYYADERYRQQWLADFPDYVMPTHEDPPFHRDCLLPQAYDEVSSRDGG